MADEQQSPQKKPDFYLVGRKFGGPTIEDIVARSSRNFLRRFCQISTDAGGDEVRVAFCSLGARLLRTSVTAD